MKNETARNEPGEPDPVPCGEGEAAKRLVRYAGADRPSRAAAQCPDQHLPVPVLMQFGTSILAAAGASDEEARTVVAELVAADLAGHPSHGVMRLIQYVRPMGTEYINPGVSLVVRESPVVSVYDVRFGFGQCIMRELLAVACRRARERGTFTAFCRNCDMSAGSVPTPGMPGEPERLRTAEARAKGIRLPGGTWYQLAQLAETLHVDVPRSAP